jgi:integrase
MAKVQLRLAVEWEIIHTSPAQGIKSPKVPASRVRYLQSAELQPLLAACSEWLRPIVVFAVATGMRRSEILGLRWLDVDLTQNVAMLPQTKNGEGRIVPLNQLAHAALRSVSRPAEGKSTNLIFQGVKPAQVSVAFARVCRKEAGA